MIAYQNFDFVDYKIQVNYIDMASSLSTEYISKIIYLKEDISLVAPESVDTEKIVEISYLHKIEYDVVDAKKYPELESYFYKTTHKAIDVLTVGNITDMSELILSEDMAILNGRAFTVIVDSSIDDANIDENFVNTFYGAFLVTRQEPEEITEKFGKLIIKSADVAIRTAELLKFAGFLYNKSDFLGQITMRALDYQTEFWLDYQWLSNLSSNKNIGFGNQNGTNYISCFYIGTKGSMDFYRLEQVKRDIQSAILKILSLRNIYDQKTLSICEVGAKNAINGHPFCNQKKTIIKKQKIEDLPVDVKAKRQIPIVGTIGFFEEVDQVIITLYNITFFYGG
jgi:hypothetical protein